MLNSNYENAPRQQAEESDAPLGQAPEASGTDSGWVDPTQSLPLVQVPESQNTLGGWL